jgi:prolipoprotein diacylglyceryltransferase
MHPRFDLFGLTIRSGTILYVAAFLAALILAMRRGPRFDVSRRLIVVQLAVFGLCFAIGCPLYYAASHWDLYAERPLSALQVWRSGTAQYGGLFLWLAVLALWFRGPGRFLNMLALWTPPFLLALMIGRLGCFMGGCCFGLPTRSVLGVYYPDWGTPSRIARRIVEGGAPTVWRFSADHSAIVPAVHPTQLYYATAALAILAGIWLTERRHLPARIIVLLAWGAYSASSLLVEQFRYFAPDTHRMGLPLNSWVSIALVVAIVVLLIGAWSPSFRQGALVWRLRRPSRSHSSDGI